MLIGIQSLLTFQDNIFPFISVKVLPASTGRRACLHKAILYVFSIIFFGTLFWIIGFAILILFIFFFFKFFLIWVYIIWFCRNMGTSVLCTLPVNIEALSWFRIMIFELLEWLCVHYKISLYGEGNWIFIFQFQRFGIDYILVYIFLLSI